MSKRLPSTVAARDSVSSPVSASVSYEYVSQAIPEILKHVAELVIVSAASLYSSVVVTEFVPYADVTA